ncbi:hypothetical protein GCM10020255_088690 [Rhodococcus baikonurensis]
MKDVAAAAPALRTVYQIDAAAGGKGVVEELTALGADISDEDVHARVAALKASDPAT